MKFTTRMTNLGIEISLHQGDGPKRLEPASNANQETPRRNYVYAHLDSAGQIFYVGTGKGKRAWSTDRHPLWCRYVQKHLNGNYQVRILQDNLSAKDAEKVEAAWIAQCSDTLVNWINMDRATDFRALGQYHKLRDANRTLIQEAKALEKSDLEEAVAMYVQAIAAIRTYAFISCEKGLIGRLLDEETAEVGRSGEIEALDRLTLCLINLGRSMEAVQRTEEYFTLYPRDIQLATSERIAGRIKKAVERMQRQSRPADGKALREGG